MLYINTTRTKIFEALIYYCYYYPLSYYILEKGIFQNMHAKRIEGMQTYLVISGILNQLLIIPVSTTMYYIISIRYRKRSLKLSIYYFYRYSYQILIYIWIRSWSVKLLWENPENACQHASTAKSCSFLYPLLSRWFLNVGCTRVQI